MSKNHWRWEDELDEEEKVELTTLKTCIKCGSVLLLIHTNTERTIYTCNNPMCKHITKERT